LYCYTGGDKLTKVITEKQIVDAIVKNWDEFFEEEQIKFFRREKSPVSWWRADLWGVVDMPLEHMEAYRASIFFEVKYQSPARDLIYEVKKGLDLLATISNPNYIAVISDDFSDPTIYDFLKANGIHMWRIDIENDDINTLKLTYYNPEETLIEDRA
jgi:hypothetical protein